MIDFALVILAVLAAATVVISVEYYRQLRRAQREYEKAKNVVEDIILSFNRSLKRENEKLDLIAFNVEGSFAKADVSLKKADALEKKVAPIEEHLTTVSQSIAQTSTSLLSGLTGLESKIKDIETAQEAVNAKLAKVEGEFQKLTVPPEPKLEPAMPVIPIRRDKAMAALTETEVQVLEMLASQGSKTAPEIKDAVHLSREHTARLMKKLYEEGYVEREADKLPFRYSIKPEMDKLLKKAENAETPPPA